MSFNIIGLIKAAIINGTPLLFGTSGEILTEKSGNLNLGVEGLMFMGGAFGLMGAFLYGNAAGDSASGAVAVAIALLCSFGIGCIGSLIFSFLTITLRANQNVTGLALTIFGTGVGQFVGELMRIKVGGNVTISNALKAAFAEPILPAALQKIPVLGQILFSYNLFVYLGVIMALVMAWFMKKTRKGLFLAAVGESPATADAAGINVTRYRYLAT
ncbi:MAG: ABC transporter permease, partial [Firmicutes bacterium]|nr:ABC transporter permease [Bacillota bacterium]